MTNTTVETELNGYNVNVKMIHMQDYFAE